MFEYYPKKHFGPFLYFKLVCLSLFFNNPYSGSNEFFCIGRFYQYLVNGLLNVTIVTRNRKIVWKHGPYCWYFPLNLKYLDIFAWTWSIWSGRTEHTSKQRKMVTCEELYSENDFEAVSATFCCYENGAKASEAVQKIAADQKGYRKCSSCIIICWITQIYLSVNNSEKWLVWRIPPTQLKKLLKLHRKKSNNWPMVSFIHNGSEITTSMGHSFKTKSTKSKATLLKDNNIFFEFQATDH